MKPLHTLLIATALLGFLGAAPGRAVAAPEARDAEIPFARIQGIDDWKMLSSDEMLIRSGQHRYYRATFENSCSELRGADHIRFETNQTGTIDKFDSIIVRGQRCIFKTLEEIPKPEKW